MKKNSNLYLFVNGIVHFIELVLLILCFEIVFYSIHAGCFIEKGVPVLVSVCYYIVYSIVNFVFDKIEQLKKEVVVDEKEKH